MEKNKYDMMNDFITLINFSSCTNSGCTFYGLNKCIIYDECHEISPQCNHRKLCAMRDKAQEVLKKKYNL